MTITLNQLLGLVYVEEKGVFGSINSLDYLNHTITINTGFETLKVDLEDVKFLSLIGSLNGEAVVEGDVFQHVDGEEYIYEIELQEDGENVVFHQLDKELERIKEGAPFHKDLLDEIFSKDLIRVGNINELEVLVEEDFDFDVKIVKDTDGVYYYACNNKDNEEIDLIKVLFIGANLLDGNYERLTVDYDEYLEFIDTEFVVEVNPQELQAYAYQLLSGGKSFACNDLGEDCNCKEVCGDNVDNELKDEDSWQ